MLWVHIYIVYSCLKMWATTEDTGVGEKNGRRYLGVGK